MAGGTRSLLAPWIGGASGPQAAEGNAGFTSLLAPWIGGASALAGGPEPEPPRGGRKDYVDRHRRQLLREDQELIEITTALGSHWGRY